MYSIFCQGFSRLLRRTRPILNNSAKFSSSSKPFPPFNQNTTREPSTFVSEHFQIGENVVQHYLERKNMVFKADEDKFNLRDCPACHDTKGRTDNIWKLYIFKGNGNAFCHRCGLNCTWFDFQQQLGDMAGLPPKLTQDQHPTIVQSHSQTKGNDANKKYEDEIDQSEAANMRKALLKDQKALEFLENRGLSRDTLIRYGVGVKYHPFQVETDPTYPGQSQKQFQNQCCIVFPWTKSGIPGQVPTVTRIKIRSIVSKTNQRILPKGGPTGFFGFHLLPENSPTVVITEGEFDAMAVYEATKIPAISLPNGAGSLPVDLLPVLERFRKIVLWLDDDLPGHEGAEKMSYKLGRGRCFMVFSKQRCTEGPKDANEALQANADLKELIEGATRPKHEQLAHVRDFRELVTKEIGEGEASNGVPFLFMPEFQKLIKGHRLGELTILTGPTGLGKTTVLSQLSLDLCLQGVQTLWGSFEVKNTRLIQTMLSQYAEGPIHRSSPAQLDKWLDRFEAMPMYLMRFHGHTEIPKVLDTMKFAIYACDIKHILLDNLQFMIGPNHYGGRKFDVQDSVVSELRQFATNHNVHITLVIHPRKEPDGVRLNVNSVFGSGKATQEADNVLLLHRHPHCVDVRYIELCKNRHSGLGGMIPYRFDRGSRRIMELDKPELEQIRVMAANAAEARIPLEGERLRPSKPAAVLRELSDDEDDILDGTNLYPTKVESVDSDVVDVNWSAKPSKEMDVDSASLLPPKEKKKIPPKSKSKPKSDADQAPASDPPTPAPKPLNPSPKPDLDQAPASAPSTPASKLLNPTPKPGLDQAPASDPSTPAPKPPTLSPKPGLDQARTSEPPILSPKPKKRFRDTPKVRRKDSMTYPSPEERRKRREAKAQAMKDEIRSPFDVYIVE